MHPAGGDDLALDRHNPLAGSTSDLAWRLWGGQPVVGV